MMRALLLYLVFLFGMGPALAQAPVYWLEFYVGVPDVQSAKAKQFQKLQSQHDLNTVMKVQVVEAQSSGSAIDWAPHQIMILRGQRQDFDRYFSSADYKKLSEIQLAGTEIVTSLVATELRADGIKFLEKAPMAALVLAANSAETSQASLALSITEVIASKGPLSSFAQSVKQVQILPLSFDDNPMDFMPAENAAESLGLIGEIVRQN